MRRWPFVVAASLPLAVHVVPAATWLDHPTLELLPRLRGVGSRSHVAITFDDGPDPASTPRFLDELDRLGWTATFFVLGETARRFPDVVVETAARGHEIGLHGDAHHSHLLMTPGAVQRDLSAGVATLTHLTGKTPVWFRPPYGELSLGSVIATRHLGLHPILWSAWGKDWRADQTPATITSRVLTELSPGGTILLHDSDHESSRDCWHATLAALPLLAEHLEPLVTVGPLRDHFCTDADIDGRKPDDRHTGETGSGADAYLGTG